MVRPALLPRAEEPNAFRSGLLPDAKSAYVIAARTVHRRERLAQEHCHVLVRPFAASGVEIPPHAADPDS